MKVTDQKRLGRVALDVTVLGFGTVALGNLAKPISEAQANDTFAAAWDIGIRYFDTAPLYGDGLGELRTSAGLRQKPRNEYVLSSKVGRLLRPRPRSAIEFGGWVDATPFELVYDCSYDGTMRAFEDSLQRLALERMEICFIHDIDVFTRGKEQPEVFRQAMDGCYRTLAKLRSEGSPQSNRGGRQRVGGLRGGAETARFRLFPACRALFTPRAGSAAIIPAALPRTGCRCGDRWWIQFRDLGYGFDRGRALQLWSSPSVDYGAGATDRRGLPRL